MNGITFIDEVYKKNPNVTFLLNAKWFYLDKFQPYIKDKKFKIYWVDMNLFPTPFHKNRKIDLTKITYGFGAPSCLNNNDIYGDEKYLFCWL